MTKDGDVPGNVLATHAAIQRAAMRLAIAIDKAENTLYTETDRDPWLVSFRIKLPDDDGDDWLAIMQGDSREGEMVAFHAATTLREVLRGAMERYTNKSLKWKADEFRRKLNG